MNAGKVSVCPGCLKAFVQSFQWSRLYCCRECAVRACERLEGVQAATQRDLAIASAEAR
jgi:hypothetical protein